MGQGLAEAGLGTVAMVASQEEQIVDRTTEVSLCNTSIVDSSVGWQTRKEGKTGPCGPLPLWQVGHSRESLAKWCQGFPPPYHQEGEVVRLFHITFSTDSCVCRTWIWFEHLWRACCEEMDLLSWTGV